VADIWCSHLIGAVELGAGAFGHLIGNGVQFAACLIQLGRTLLKISERSGKKLAQPIGCLGQST
jgi:hypothetical protein